MAYPMQGDGVQDEGVQDEGGENTPGESASGPGAQVPRDEAKTGAAGPVVIKKYANRRLYNTESSSYITLDTLAEMVREGRDFVVYDAKSGEDITRGVLTQIIVEEESKGRALLPTAFLRQLIGFYGDSVQNLVPRYLEQAMAGFARQQEQVRRAVQQTMQQGLTPFMPFPIEEVGRQNLAMMERAMSLFSPFHREAEAAEPKPAAPPPPAASASPKDAELAALRAEIEALRGQLALVAASQPGSRPATEGNGSDARRDAVRPSRAGQPAKAKPG